MKKRAWLSSLCVILGMALALGGQTITVDSPAAGAIWAIGVPQTIVWTKSGAMDDRVLIRLRNAGGGVLTISADTANDSEFSWTIPASVAPGQYYVRVRTLDDAVFDDSGTFSIAPALPPPPPPPPPSLTVTAPNGGESWALLSQQVIHWTAVNVQGKVRLELKKDQGPWLGIIASDLDAYAGSHAWAVGKYGINQTAAKGEYRVIVRSLSNIQVADQSDQPFTLKQSIRHVQNAPRTMVMAKPDLVTCMETAVYVPLKTIGHVHVHIRNIGQGTAKAPIEYEIITSKGNDWKRTLEKDLGPGESCFLLRTGDASMTEATSWFRAIADPDDHIAEANEENNSTHSFVFMEKGNPTYSTPIRCGDGSTLQAD